MYNFLMLDNNPVLCVFLIVIDSCVFLRLIINLCESDNGMLQNSMTCFWSLLQSTNGREKKSLIKVTSGLTLFVKECPGNVQYPHRADKTLVLWSHLQDPHIL